MLTIFTIPGLFKPSLGWAIQSASPGPVKLLHLHGTTELPGLATSLGISHLPLLKQLALEWPAIDHESRLLGEARLLDNQVQQMNYRFVATEGLVQFKLLLSFIRAVDVRPAMSGPSTHQPHWQITFAAHDEEDLNADQLKALLIGQFMNLFCEDGIDFINALHIRWNRH